MISNTTAIHIQKTIGYKPAFLECNPKIDVYVGGGDYIFSSNFYKTCKDMKVAYLIKVPDLRASDINCKRSKT